MILFRILFKEKSSKEEFKRVYLYAIYFLEKRSARLNGEKQTALSNVSYATKIYKRIETKANVLNRSMFERENSFQLSDIYVFTGYSFVQY